MSVDKALAIKPGDTLTFTGIRPTSLDNVYAIQLDYEFGPSQISVRCMYFYLLPGKKFRSWNCVGIDTETEIYLRDSLLEMGCLPEEWIYLTLSREANA
jgi:hypothetical protein